MNVTAAYLRSDLRSKPNRTKGLSDAALATIAEGARGKVHPDAVRAFNKGRPAHRHYVVGATKAVTATAKAQAAAKREALAEAGVAVGKRGPLPKAAKQVLAQSKG